MSEQAVAADPREAACYPCVPWFSRLPGGLDFNGKHYDLAPTLPACDPEHALHGHGWVNPWTVTAHSKDRLLCRYDHAPSPKLFPFPFSAIQDFSVSADQFRIALAIKNTGDEDMPAGLGLHPFFPCNKHTRLNCTGHYGPVPDDAIDDTLKGWDGRAEIIQDGLRVTLNSNAPILHFYSPEKADFFCAEPITHRPGHFGKEVLEPGETMTLFMNMKIKFETF